MARISLVTGGTRGIGFAVASALLDAGDVVAVTGTTDDTARQGVDALRAKSSAADRVMGFACDVRQPAMVEAARARLVRFGDRVQYVVADLGRPLPIESVDAILSTATFHWVPDHDALFRNLAAVLRPGGRLVAQCGGGPNIQRLHDRAATLMRTPEFAAYFERWRDPWEFADADITRRRLDTAGFTSIVTSIEPAPVIHADPEAFGTYLTNIICRHHLAYLPTRALQQRFVDALTGMAASDPVPFELDYWRLNIEAVKPK